ncbi:MAG: efflux RND transporter permease subunit [Gemmatimonadetes bacterium]|nr:efflux RND transporter permease subunit [Gemmatimonadota bacterium]MYC69822.1 efflux RND transporter permease subunit [Gemmatimonadota bacterium]MYI64179.1 efflux RND transporter permease subunit [Gemmatimonadota bacterium]
MDRLVRFFLGHKLVAVLMLAGLVGWGLSVAPFAWKLDWLPRDPVPVDAIPDIGENQQIVFSEWAGRSPQDVEDQVTYPLTVALLGVPGVETIRSSSMFGFSSIYVIFAEEVDFYWSRSRILEKLNSLPAGLLPEGVQPALGPDATALGQVFWYTLEGRDEQGAPTGGWDLHELRGIQDWQVRYALLAADGVSEVASVGGFVQEYQIDVNPDAMRAYGVRLDEVFHAVHMSNRDVGARTVELNRAEYVIRGIGFVKGLADLENAVIKARDNVPIYVKNVARVALGPALRRGALDKEGAEVVGGVVVARYGANPLAAIESVKAKIAEIGPSLPKKTLPDGRVSQVQVIPFYDRSGLIEETLGTLERALSEEVLVTVIVVLALVMNLRGAMLVSGLLPLAVLACFAAMKVFGIDANIVALSGIAIAIGTMVDMGIVISENILKHLEDADAEDDRLEVVFRATREVGGAVLTAVLTTVVGFLPVFAMQGAEGKLFAPLAFTKTFALLAAVWLSLTALPALAHCAFGTRLGRWAPGLWAACGLGVALALSWWVGLLLIAIGAYHLLAARVPERVRLWVARGVIAAAAVGVVVVLAEHWLPLGPEKGGWRNFIFAAGLIGGLLALFRALQHVFPRVLRWCLDHKGLALLLPLLLLLVGASAWLGFARVFGFVPPALRHSAPFAALDEALPGLGKEFMPPLDEGSFLWMPTTMPHASIGEVLDVLQKQNAAIAQIPEVESAVGKLGRAESPLDPAPISMIETVINYRAEYLTNEDGRRRLFAFDEHATDLFRASDGSPSSAPDGEPYKVQGRYIRDETGRLVPDDDGRPFRLWRPPLDPALNPGRTAWPGIQGPDDIWAEIARAGQIPGSTSAPKLQPIAARLVMLQSGMRAPMGVEIKGPSLEAIERAGLEIERLLKKVPSVEPATVNADRIVGKPYLEIHIDREAIARHGIALQKVQDVIEIAIGGKLVTTTVEGRERYPVRVRYMRELRDSVEELVRILVPAPDGAQIPLGELAEIRYVRGPQVIKSEDTFLLGYVLFDKKPGYAEVDVVEACRYYLASKRANGDLVLETGVSYTFAGSYENQLRAQKKLNVLLPLALAIIFLILYFQFGNAATALMVFSGVAVAWAGGFAMLWLYGQEWFLDFSVFGTQMRDLFHVRPLNLSVAVWVGFLALFGIASDNGVIVATYLRQLFREQKPATVEAMRHAALAAGVRRIRPCLMTAATTILALVPVLTASGRGADLMLPMAIPTFGGMMAVVLTAPVVPVLYCAVEEWKLRVTAWRSAE